jgi:gamma-glutamylcyclotransferase (GGCT)/AIG2-like uncharacterized protein YtfP
VDNKIFAYGTLLVPSVMKVVTGQSFAFEHATLQGYARYKIKGHTFPGIIESTNQSVEGIVYNAIDEASLQRLDAFESDVYYRKKVMVTLGNHEQTLAYTYVIAPEHSNLLTDQDWDLEQFQQDHLPTYLKRIWSHYIFDHIFFPVETLYLI